MITDDATIDILANDDNTTDDDMDTDMNVDAEHVYIHGREPKGRGKPSSTREPDGIGHECHWVLSLAHGTGRAILN